MDNSLDKEVKAPIDQMVIIQMVTLSVIVVVMVLTLVSFIRIYSSKKEQILKDMQTESSILETVITDHLNYSRYFINVIGRNIQSDPNNLEFICKVLKDHFTSQNFNILFGWRKYSWINNNFQEVVTSTRGVLFTPRNIKFIKQIVENTAINNTDRRNKIVFYASRNSSKGNSLKVIDNISDDISKEYIGSVVLSYDLDTMIRSLNRRKKNQSTNFVIVNQQLNLIAQSKPFISNVIDDNENFDSHLQDVLKKLQLRQNGTENVAFLDMINGINYFISPLKGLPFTIIVNIDNDKIRKDIINSIAKRFIEVCIFAFVCIFIVISIYKRETFLRAKAEKATLIANNATKAKTDFLAFTAHEIRSPLGFILTGSEMMTKELMGVLPEKYKKYADGIHQNSKVILDFITDILDENQIIEGKFKIINSLNNVGNIVDEAIRINLARFNKRNIDIVTDIEKSFPLLVCDKRRILQVCSNLISNSIKYSEDNTVITIKGEIIEQGVRLSFIDQGIGIKESEVPIALSAYGTLNEGGYYSVGSYGLGLTIVKMLLDAHDAKLVINSTEEKGTNVQIIFPKYKMVYKTKKIDNDE